MDFIEKCFKLKENKTTFKTELMAGLTTFMTMAYILVVNPSILSTTGMDAGALLTATCIASALGTFFMAFFANYPFVLAPGMGLNAYFAFTICAQKGYSWHVALAAVFVEGIIFIILSAVNVREAIFNAIPANMKKAVSVDFTGFFEVTVVCAYCHRTVTTVTSRRREKCFHHNHMPFRIVPWFPGSA